MLVVVIGGGRGSAEGASGRQELVDRAKKSVFLGCLCAVPMPCSDGMALRGHLRVALLLCDRLLRSGC